MEGKRFGLDELIIANEATSITNGSSTFACPTTLPTTPVNTVTCDGQTTTSTKFCGWTTPVQTSAKTQITTLDWLEDNYDNDYRTGYLIEPTGNAAALVTLKSAIMQPNNKTSTFTIRYILFGSRVTASLGIANHPVATLEISKEPGRWSYASVELPPFNTSTQVTVARNFRKFHVFNIGFTA